MGIFGRKSDNNIDLSAFDDTPVGRRKLNVLMQIAIHVRSDRPDVTLEITANVTNHPDLYRIRGWAYAEKEDLPQALAEFEKGFARGEIDCGVYLHRLLRENSDDHIRFDEIGAQLLPYYQAKNFRLMYAQARLANEKKDYESAITNAISIMEEKNQPTVGLWGTVFYGFFSQMSQEITEKISKKPLKPTDDELQKSWDAIMKFFESELKTAEGGPLGWNPYFYIFAVAEYLFREIEEGDPSSAPFLDDFNDFYVGLMKELDPPKPPKTFSKDFIWETMLQALEKGSLYAILGAKDFAKANGFPVSEVKKYEEEFKLWGFEKFL
jgi:hypothetical protein